MQASGNGGNARDPMRVIREMALLNDQLRKKYSYDLTSVIPSPENMQSMLAGYYQKFVPERQHNWVKVATEFSQRVAAGSPGGQEWHAEAVLLEFIQLNQELRLKYGKTLSCVADQWLVDHKEGVEGRATTSRVSLGYFMLIWGLAILCAVVAYNIYIELVSLSLPLPPGLHQTGLPADSPVFRCRLGNVETMQSGCQLTLQPKRQDLRETRNLDSILGGPRKRSGHHSKLQATRWGREDAYGRILANRVRTRAFPEGSRKADLSCSCVSIRRVQGADRGRPRDVLQRGASQHHVQKRGAPSMPPGVVSCVWRPENCCFIG